MIPLRAFVVRIPFALVSGNKTVQGADNPWGWMEGFSGSWPDVVLNRGDVASVGRRWKRLQSDSEAVKWLESRVRGGAGSEKGGARPCGLVS